MNENTHMNENNIWMKNICDKKKQISETNSKMNKNIWMKTKWKWKNIWTKKKKTKMNENKNNVEKSKWMEKIDKWKQNIEKKTDER